MIFTQDVLKELANATMVTAEMGSIAIQVCQKDVANTSELLNLSQVLILIITCDSIRLQLKNS